MTNFTITRTTHTGFLVIIYDESLIFKYHIDALTLKISKHIVVLYQIKDLMSQYVLSAYIIHISTLYLLIGIQSGALHIHLTYYYYNSSSKNL